MGETPSLQGVAAGRNVGRLSLPVDGWQAWKESEWAGKASRRHASDLQSFGKNLTLLPSTPLSPFPRTRRAHPIDAHPRRRRPAARVAGRADGIADNHPEHRAHKRIRDSIPAIESNHHGW